MQSCVGAMFSHQSPEDKLIAHLQRAALDRAGWQDFLFALERHLGGAKASIHGVSARPEAPFLSVSGGFDPEFVQLYMTHYHRINPFMPLSAALSQGQARVSPMDLPDNALQRTEFYNDWLRPQDDLSIAVALKTRAIADRALVLSLNIRRRDGERQALKAQRLLTRLQPHLSHAFHVAETVSRLSLSGGTTVMGQGGLIMIGPAMLLIWADDGAMQHEGTVFRLAPPFSKLMFLNGAVQDWARAVAQRTDAAAAVTPSIQTADGWQFRVVTPGNGPHLPSPFFGGHQLSHPRILIVLSRDSTGVSLLTRLQSQFRLTRAEAEIAEAIAEGRSTTEIAAMRQASLHTVRNQIRSVLAKLGVRDRVGAAGVLAQMKAVPRVT